MSGQKEWKQLEEKIGSAIKLSRWPVAVSFLDVRQARCAGSAQNLNPNGDSNIAVSNAELSFAD